MAAFPSQAWSGLREDWGSARILAREDKHDLRIQPEPTTPSIFKTERREKCEATPNSALVTLDGDIVGTPSLIPPEQTKVQFRRRRSGDEVSRRRRALLRVAQR